MEYIDYNIVIGEDLKIIASSEGISEVGELRLDKKEIESAMEQLADEKIIVDKNFIKLVGTKLAEALFTPEIKRHFYTVKSKDVNKGVRFRLSSKSPEISSYPWEALYENNKYMAVSVEIPLTRFIPNITSEKKIFDKPLKILTIGSNPSKLGLPAVQVEREIEGINDSLKREIDNGAIKLDIERIGDIARIMDRLNSEQYNIIHFIGHGIFKDDVGYLALENSDGGLILADHERIGQLFQNQNSLGLVVLNACQGAITSTSKAFTGLAPELIKIGVPSVVAMRYSITNQTAKLFSKEFYKNLPKMPIDENIQRVRQRILVDPDSSPKDFIIPVLFMNAPDGIIFAPRDIAAKELAQSPALNNKMEEVEKAWDELTSGSDAIGVKDFWLLIRGLHKDYKKELNKKALNRIENMVIVVPGLIRDHEQAILEGLKEKAKEIEQTIMLNFKTFVEAF